MQRALLIQLRRKRSCRRVGRPRSVRAEITTQTCNRLGVLRLEPCCLRCKEPLLRSHPRELCAQFDMHFRKARGGRFVL